MHDPLTISLRKPSEPRPPAPTPTPPPTPRRPRRSHAPLIIGCAVVLILTTGAYWYLQPLSQSSDTPPPAPEAVQKDIDDIVARVGKHIVLPEGEEPTVATVTAPEELIHLMGGRAFEWPPG